MHPSLGANSPKATIPCPVQAIGLRSSAAHTGASGPQDTESAGLTWRCSVAKVLHAPVDAEVRRLYGIVNPSVLDSYCVRDSCGRLRLVAATGNGWFWAGASPPFHLQGATHLRQGPRATSMHGQWRRGKRGRCDVGWCRCGGLWRSWRLLCTHSQPVATVEPLKRWGSEPVTPKWGHGPVAAGRSTRAKGDRFSAIRFLSISGLRQR
jgi:hypothetical protein